MSEIDPYFKVMFLRGTADLRLPDGRHKIDEMQLMLLDRVQKIINDYKIEDLIDGPTTTVSLFDDFVAASVFAEEEEKYAGRYYVYIQPNYPKYKEHFLGRSEINAAAKRIGNRYFPDVLEGYRKVHGDEIGTEFPPASFVPASDRIVTLNHNQVDILDAEAGKIIEAVSEQNQIGRVGLREMIIGQLKAGRELIRAGEFKLYLLRGTLINTLAWLAKKFEKDLIGDLAVKLLEALAEHLGEL